MRIAHVSDVYLPALGGIELHVADLAQRQAQRGDDVVVVTFEARSRDERYALQTHRGSTVRRVRSLTAGVAIDLRAFDVVHAHVSAVSPLACTLASSASRQGVPTLTTVHSLWRGLGPLPAASAAAFGLRSAPVAWTAVSGVAAESVRRWLPADRRVAVLPNAVDVTPRLATPLREAGEPVEVVSTMRLARLKRPLPLVRMVRQLRRTTSTPFRLTLIGDGRQRRAVEAAVRGYGLADGVRLTGRLDRASVLQALAGSDIYVAPAPLESFGLAALEARCVGLPVLARYASGVGDFVTHGIGGYLARSDADMVRLLATLVDDADTRRRMAEHNRTTASELTWDMGLVRTDEAYEQAARLAAQRSGVPWSRSAARGVGRVQ
jgi:glycosyltransferase involved in cell wall biosynthesis